MQNDYGLINPVPEDAESESLPKLLEQYKTYVQTQEAVVDRRQKANSYYLSANSFFITIYLAYIEFTKAFAVKSEISDTNVTVTQNSLSVVNKIGTAAICLIISIIGIILCFAWRRAIKSYCDLNAGKCTIIIMIEKKLPANTFDAEWKALKDSNYRTFTSSEKVVPLAFVFAYVTLAIVTIFSIIFSG